MTLLLDAGNTRIKWAYLVGDAVSPGGACASADVPALRCLGVVDGGKRAVVSCVAGDTVRLPLANMLSEAGFQTHWLRSEHANHGLLSRYEPPESLGTDRYAALVGAARRFHRDCVVVSMGTAMTVDMLTSDGDFLGGCIAPGPELMRESLYLRTAGVASLAGGWQAMPRDTGAAVGTGITLALLGVVQGMRERLAEIRGVASEGHLPGVILGGGARHWLRPRLQGEVVEVDELVLEGLAWIARDLGFAD